MRNNTSTPFIYSCIKNIKEEFLCDKNLKYRWTFASLNHAVANFINCCFPINKDERYNKDISKVLKARLIGEMVFQKKHKEIIRRGRRNLERAIIRKNEIT